MTAIPPRTPRRVTWQPWHGAGLIVLLSTAMHLWAAGRVGLGSDEAHYALFGLYPALSYVDHPPMAGWLQAVALWFSHGELALRIIPSLLFVASSAVLYRLAYLLFPQSGPWFGCLTLAVFHSGVMFQLIGFSMLPEAPLLLFGLLAVWLMWQAVERGRPSDWVGLGVAFGLAGLSKYTAITLVVTALLYLAGRRRLGLLRTPEPWIAAQIALLLVFPVIIWNAGHDWASFSYQLHHGFKPRDWELSRFLTTLAAQALAYSPGILLGGGLALAAGWRERQDRGVWMSLALALPILLLFAWSSGFEEALPHWTALAWAGSTPLIARWLSRSWSLTWPLGRWRWFPVRVLTRWSAGYSLVLIALIFSEFGLHWLPVPDGKHPFRPLFGWPQAAAHALSLQAQMAEREGGQPLLLVHNWSLASRLAWYARPAAVKVADGRPRTNQYDLWYGPPKEGDSGILVAPAHYRLPPPTGAPNQFNRCRELDRLPVYSSGRRVNTFVYYACHNYREAPRYYENLFAGWMGEGDEFEEPRGFLSWKSQGTSVYRRHL